MIRQVEELKLENQRLLEEIHALKTDPKLIERLAHELGLVGPDEIKVIIDKKKK